MHPPLKQKKILKSYVRRCVLDCLKFQMFWVGWEFQQTDSEVIYWTLWLLKIFYLMLWSVLQLSWVLGCCWFIFICISNIILIRFSDTFQMLFFFFFKVTSMHFLLVLLCIHAEQLARYVFCSCSCWETGSQVVYHYSGNNSSPKFFVN